MDLTLGRPSSSSQDAASPPATPEDRHVRKLTAYLRSLEDERCKIEAFKRELPLCMQLLATEIEASRMQLGDCTDNVARLDNLNTDKAISSSRSSCKGDFIVSNYSSWGLEEPNHGKSINEDEVLPQLQASCWQNTGHGNTQDYENFLDITSVLYKTSTTSCREDKLQGCKTTLEARPGGAFVPFFKGKMQRCTDDETKTMSSSPLNQEDTYHNENSSEDTDFLPGLECSSFQPFTENLPPVLPSATRGVSNHASPHRKPRRCWSTELHRKFVNALKQLGGSEVATPKQIREVMQVEGLTNDEVKSHLQKYRLHTKRPTLIKGKHTPTAPATQAMGSGACPQLVVLGGLWVPHDYHQLKQPLYLRNVPKTMDPSVLNHSIGMQTQHSCTASAQ